MTIPLPPEAMNSYPSWSIIAAKLFAVAIALYGSYLIISTLWKDDKK